MHVFVDTSAFYALLDRNDDCHAAASAKWSALLDGADRLITSNYVTVESIALVQHRLGLHAVRALVDDLLGVVETLWVDKTDHEGALIALLTANRRGLSFVDCTSFQLMRRFRIHDAFAFDAHFDEQSRARESG